METKPDAYLSAQNVAQLLLLQWIFACSKCSFYILQRNINNCQHSPNALQNCITNIINKNHESSYVDDSLHTCQFFFWGGGRPIHNIVPLIWVQSSDSELI